MRQDYHNGKLIKSACATLGTQLDLLGQAIIVRENQKKIKDLMTENRREVESGRLLPGQITAFNRRFKNLKTMYETAAAQKALLDAQLIGSSQLAELTGIIKEYAETAVNDYWSCQKKEVQEANEQA